MNIGLVKANPTIYIRDDGSVDGTDVIENKGNMYTFTDNIYSSVVVEKDNIKIYGQGYAVLRPQNGLGQSPEKTGILLDGQNNVSILNLTVQNFLYGIRINNSFNIHIDDNKITENINGIFVEHSSETSIRRNKITNNIDYGINVVESSDTNIGNNIITDNSNVGVNLFFKSINLNELGLTIIYNCIIRENGVGLSLSSLNNFIKPAVVDCNLTDNGIGIHIEASLVGINCNNIVNNDIGIQLAASDNDIDHNNFINNTRQVYDVAWNNPETSSSVNNWYEGDTGNYWSDYDGTGDTPYIIDENNQDPFPLNEPLELSDDPWDPGIDYILPAMEGVAVLLIFIVAVVVVVFIWVKKQRKQKLEG